MPPMFGQPSDEQTLPPPMYGATPQQPDAQPPQFGTYPQQPGTPPPFGSDPASAQPGAFPPPPGFGSTPPPPGAQSQQPYQPPFQQPGFPQQGYGYSAMGGSEQYLSNVQLNWWLSAFFGIIPAAIFWLTGKGKDPLYDDHLKENMNFSLLRLFVTAIVTVFRDVSGIGGIVSSLGGLLSLALFIMAIVAAVKAVPLFRQGQPYRYPFRVEMIK